jgi:hypothetical protein
MLTSPILNVLRPYLEEFLGTQGKAQFRKRLQKAEAGIVKRMAADREKNAAVWTAGGDRHRIRYTLYWLCKALVKSGTVADFARDHYDDSVVAVVEPGAAGMTDALLVQSTADAFTEQVF